MLPLKDNALFMQNWRERMRPATVISAVILTIIILVLIFLGSYIETPTYGGPTQKVSPHLKAFWAIAIAQGVLLLLVGSASANNMAARERSGGTLDFHRASPTSRFDQILGILMGAPSLEWCVFLSTLPISFALANLGHLGYLRVLEFYGSIILCGILFHSFAIFLGMYNDRKQGNVVKRGGIFQIIILFYFMSGGLYYMSNNFSSLYHLTALPQYSNLAHMIFIREYVQPYPHSYYYHDTPYLNYMFYTLSLPSLLLQAIVQIPLIAFLWIATGRKISQPEHPVFSKPQSLLCVGFILFLYVGSALSVFLDGSLYYYQMSAIKSGFLYFLLILGLLGALGATPTQLLFIKGLRKIRKLRLKKVGWDEDYSSNSAWALVFFMVILVAYESLAPWIVMNFVYRRLIFVILILSILSFAWALEYFRLSKQHKKKTLFAVAVSIFWIFIPILGAVLNPILKSNPHAIHYFLATSPFSSITDIFSASQNTYSGPQDFVFYIHLGVNSAIAIVTLILVNLERSRLRNTT